MARSGLEKPRDTKRAANSLIHRCSKQARRKGLSRHALEREGNRSTFGHWSRAWTCHGTTTFHIKWIAIYQINWPPLSVAQQCTAESNDSRGGRRSTTSWLAERKKIRQASSSLRPRPSAEPSGHRLPRCPHIGPLLADKKPRRSGASGVAILYLRRAMVRATEACARFTRRELLAVRAFLKRSKRLRLYALTSSLDRLTCFLHVFAGVLLHPAPRVATGAERRNKR